MGIETKFDNVYRVRVVLNPQETSFTRALRELDQYNNAAYQQSVRTPEQVMIDNIAESRRLDPLKRGQLVDRLA